MLVRPHSAFALVLVPLALGCPAPEPPATETESSSSTAADSSTTVVPPTTLDSSGTTVVPDTSTTSDTTTTGVDTSATDTTGTSSGSSSDDTTTGGVVCEEPFEPNEDIGSIVGLALVMGTNLGAGDHYPDLCGLRTFGSDTDSSDTDVFPETDTGIFPETDTFPPTTGLTSFGSFTDTFPPTTGFSDSLPTSGFTSFGSFTDTFPSTTGFSDSLPTTGFTSFGDTGFDTEFQPPTYEEYLVRWTAPSAGTYRIDLVGSDYDTMLGIADACGMGEIECNDDCFELQSGLAVEVDDGETITIIIGGYGGQVGEFVLNIEEDAGFECPGFK